VQICRRTLWLFTSPATSTKSRGNDAEVGTTIMTEEGRFTNLQVINEHPPGRNSARCLSYPSIQVETAASRWHAEGQRARPSRAPCETLYFARTKVCREDPRHLVVQGRGIGKCGKSKLQQYIGSKWVPHRAADFLRNKKCRGCVGRRAVHNLY
jgi:hypothetical protein